MQRLFTWLITVFFALLPAIVIAIVVRHERWLGFATSPEVSYAAIALTGALVADLVLVRAKMHGVITAIALALFLALLAVSGLIYGMHLSESLSTDAANLPQLQKKFFRELYPVPVWILSAVVVLGALLQTALGISERKEREIFSR
jgi:hypothetical protein